ncbi:MAG: MMPL family transporter [Thermoplasmata archaeon]|nr:MMPL family transporter [Thermoplasmata archaeon]
MFGKIATFVVKHPKKITVIWAIFLILAAPLAIRYGDVLVYEEAKITPENLESKVADRIIEKEFPGNVPNGSAIVVIQNHNVSSRETKHFVENLTARIKESKDIALLDDVTSVYSLAAEILHTTSSAIHDAFPGLKENVNGTTYLIFGLPDNFNTTAGNAQAIGELLYGFPENYVYLWNLSEQSAMMVYGMPLQYAMLWNYTNFSATLVYSIPKAHAMFWQYSSGTTVEEKDNNTYATFSTYMDMFADQYGLNGSEKAMLRSYYNLFANYWNITSAEHNVSEDANATLARAQKAVDDNALADWCNLTFNTTEEKEFFEKIHKFWNVTTWYLSLPPLIDEGDNTPMLNNFTLHLIKENIGVFASEIPEEFLQPVEHYIDAFGENWSRELGNYSLLEETAMVAGNLSRQVLFEEFANLTEPVYPGINFTAIDLLTKLNDTFDYYDWNNRSAYNNTTALDQFTYSVFSKVAMSGATELFMNYSSRFFAVWNQSTGTAYGRGLAAINQTIPGFIQNISDNTTREFFENVSATINIDNWDSRSAIDGFAYTYMVQMITESTPPAMLNTTLNYLQAFYQNWTALNSTAYNDTDNRTETVLNGMLLPYINSSLSGDERAFVSDIATWFNLKNYANGSAHVEFSCQYLAKHTPLKDANFIRRVAEAGSDAQVWSVVNDSLETNGVWNLPMEFHPAILHKFISPDNGTMLVSITFLKGSNNASVDNNVVVLRQIISDLNRGYNYTVYLTGDVPLSHDIAEASWGEVSHIDTFAVAFAIIFMIIYFVSIVAPFVPLGAVGIVILIANAIVFIVGAFLIQIYYIVPTLLFTVLLGAGTDYTIFLLSRYREERRKGHGKEDAVKTSVTWAGESIATSGGTVMIAFGALTVSSLPLVQTIGAIVFVGIGIGILAALTLLPALILLIGDRIFWPSKIKPLLGNDGKRNYFWHAARFSLKHPKAIVIAAFLITLPAAYAALTLETGYDFVSTMPDVESKQGMNALGEGFGKGDIMPTYILINLTEPVKTGDTYNTAIFNDTEALCSRIMALGGIAKVYSITRPFGDPIDYTDKETLDFYKPVIDTNIGNSNKTILISIVLVEQPFHANAIKKIDEVRGLVKGQKTNYQSFRNAEIYFTGSTAGMQDIKVMMDKDFPYMMLIVLVGAYIVLLIVLGSVLIPLRLLGVTLMTATWALALTMFVFTIVLGQPLLWLMPLILFVVLVGLGLDYDILLTTRIREEVSKGKSDEEAITTAVERTGGIITICGLIMAGALGSMMISGMGMLRQFGFALCAGILIDTAIMRIYLVPSMMILLKKWNWWAPGRLQRVRRAEKKKGKTVKKEEILRKELKKPHPQKKQEAARKPEPKSR